MRLRAQGVEPDRIVRLTLGVPAPVLRTIAEPAAEKALRVPATTRRSAAPTRWPRDCSPGPGNRATDSCVPRGLHRRGGGRPARLALAPACLRRGRGVHRRLSAPVPPRAHRGIDDGTTVTERVMVNRGSPQNPLDTGELTAKFLANARGAGAEQAVRDLADEVWNIAAAPDTRA